MLKKIGPIVWQAAGKRCDIEGCARLIRPGETVDKAVIDWGSDLENSIIICSDCREKVYGQSHN